MPSYPEVTPAMMREFDRQISGRLTPPEKARHRIVENKKTGTVEEHYRWNESARITGVEVTEVVSSAGDDHDLYTVGFEITATKGSGEHVGDSTRYQGRINPDAYAAGNKDDGQFKMSSGTLVRLTQLVRSSGFPIKGGLSSAQMAGYFPIDGASPLIGREVNIEIHQQESEMAPSGWNEEVSNIFPLTAMKPAAEV